MGEVLCVATWDEKKEKQLNQWVAAKPDRYVIHISEETQEMPHPRITSIQPTDLLFHQVATDYLYLPFVYEDPSHPALQRLARIQTEIHYRTSDFMDQGVKLLTNFKNNLLQKTALAEECFGKFTAYPAVICGAGPSLKETLPFLKEHRDHFLIIACGAGLKALLTAGIEPHLTVQIDPDPLHQFSKKKVPVFYQLRTSHEVMKKMEGPRFLMAGSGDFPLERWITDQLGLESSSDGGWTAVTQGTALAKAMDSPAIYFAGVDFSVTSDGVYAKGVSANQHEHLIKTTLSDGSIVQTRPDWLFAAEWLNNYVLTYPEIKWGLLSKKNLLMPAIVPTTLQDNLGPAGISNLTRELFSQAKFQETSHHWKTIAVSFDRCRSLTHQFLVSLEKIFPSSPRQDAACQALLQEIEKEFVAQNVLEPIWSHWEIVLKREENHPDALLVHKILLLKSLADRFYV